MNGKCSHMLLIYTFMKSLVFEPWMKWELAQVAIHQTSIKSQVKSQVFEVKSQLKSQVNTSKSQASRKSRNTDSIRDSTPSLCLGSPSLGKNTWLLSRTRTVPDYTTSHYTAYQVRRRSVVPVASVRRARLELAVLFSVGCIQVISGVNSLVSHTASQRRALTADHCRTK